MHGKMDRRERLSYFCDRGFLVMAQDAARLLAGSLAEL